MSSSQEQAPKVFVSHGSEDKATYAEPLARALICRGVDAWLDRWEIKPGDSLVQRIFEEGLAGAQAMLIVLSATSVGKPWVRAELDTGVVRRIAGTLKVIPIIVDDCEVPESLKATLWMDLRQEGIDQIADRIAASMFGLSEKPALGSPPRYVGSSARMFPGLSPVDMAVLEALYREGVEGNFRFLQPSGFVETLQAEGVNEEALNESVDVLVNRGQLESKHHFYGQAHSLVAIPAQVLLRLAESFGVDVAAAKRTIAGEIINKEMDDLDELVSKTGLPKGLVDAVLIQFQTNGFIKLGRAIQRTSVFGVTPSFKRWLADQ